MASTSQRRDILTTALIALIAATIASLPQLDRLRGLSIDVLTWLRWSIAGQLHDPMRSPTVVIALDEETYRRKPFAGTPSITWTPEIGKILTAVVDAGAKVVGFDVIFPTSLEQSEISLGGDTIGDRLRGFDRSFLRALATAARQGKLVLGQVQHLHQPIQPFEAQRIAVGYYSNIRPLNLFADRDGVVRRVPLSFEVDGGTMPSMAVELASRAMGPKPEFATDGSVWLAGSHVPQSTPNTVVLNFDGGADDIPTYSLADLVACADSGDKNYFQRQFGGRVVLIGALLDVEDRSVASKRFATGIEGARAPRCRLPFEPPERAFARDSIAGVYVHATAINNLIRGDALNELGRLPSWIVNLAASAIAATLTLQLASPLRALLSVAALGALWTGIANWAFIHALALPLIDTIVATLLAFAIMNAYRFVIADSEKRLLRNSFSLYLAPAVIERMLAANVPPSLGGETRTVTVYFSDIAAFSAISERLNPRELVALMNEYLSAMTEIIEAHGGFVDKYIGDAIVAVFGAPADDPDHAISAVRAALASEAKLAAMNQMGLTAFAGLEIRQRIGLNSGDTLVGNIGSPRRFNYTVMGDTVNLAARLEGANKLYGTSIMAAEATAALVGNRIVWRELDTIRVSGRAAPTRVYEPRADAGDCAVRNADACLAYAEGLARWRMGDFGGATEAFGRAGPDDLPSVAFRERACLLVANPPGGDWTPIHVLDTK